MNPTMPNTLDAATRDAEQAGVRVPQPISTRTHAILDYTLGPTLDIMPEAFGFPRSGAAAAVPRAVGGASMTYSMITRYELGIRPTISMKTHLILDAIGGGILAASPWMFGFANSRRKRAWLPHILFAAADMAIVAMSRSRSNPSAL